MTKYIVKVQHAGNFWWSVGAEEYESLEDAKREAAKTRKVLKERGRNAVVKVDKSHRD